MAIVIRSVNLNSEKENLVALLRRNFNLYVSPSKDLERFDWLYLHNPAGPAWAWFAYDDESEKLVGLASVFPRVVWMGGKLQRCGAVGDFAIDISHRSLGPALKLQRATFEPVDQGALAFCYDCPPHEAGMATFHRLGMQANYQINRYAKLIKVDRHLKKFIGQGRYIAPVCIVGNALLNLWLRSSRKVPNMTISLHADRFGEEFSYLDKNHDEKDNILRSQRTAEYLNWRYRDDPMRQYQVLTAYRSGELLGYAIFYISHQDAYILDLFAPKAPSITVNLLNEVSFILQKTSVQAVHIFASNQSDICEFIRKSYYRYRSQSAHVVSYINSSDDTIPSLSYNLDCHFTYADILTSPRI